MGALFAVFSIIAFGLLGPACQETMLPQIDRPPEHGTPIHAAQQELIQQQMIELGHYLHGLNKNIAADEPNYAEMATLSESLRQVTQQMQDLANQSTRWRKEFTKLTEIAVDVTALSRASNPEAITKTKELIQNCGGCHRAAMESQ